jgi:protein-disulfide isomerase
VSQKNRDGKHSAREALREQRAKEEARHRRRRTAIVAGGVVAVLAVAAVISVVVADHNSGGSSADSSAPVAPPKGAVGKDNLIIPVGAADAPSTLTVWEDFRCPACDAFEKAFTPTIHQLEDSGQLRSEYRLVLLIDGNLGGTGSLNAANAAACAQDQGKFRAYHDVLYDNQPEEQDDKFADKNTLLQLAGQVPGLRNAAFTACVNDAFGASGFNSTPTILLNGKSIYGSSNLTPASLTQMVKDANKGKPAGKVTATPSP